MREYTLDQVHIPRMYFHELSPDFDNKRDYLSAEFKTFSESLENEERTSDDEHTSGSVNNAGPSNATKRNAELTTREQTKRLRNA